MKTKILRGFSGVLGVLILICVILKFSLWPHYLNNFIETSDLRTRSVWVQALYFTNISNVLVGLFLVAYAFKIFKKITQNSLVELALSSYILITLIIYYTGVLFGNSMWCGYVFYDIICVFLHLVSPLGFVTLYFLKPKKDFFYFKDMLKVLIFPTCYALLISVVGNVLLWFPYFFFNPYKLGVMFNLENLSPWGAGVAVSIAGLMILSIFFLTEAVLIGLNNYVFVKNKT